jgi:putative aldouronate transport system substrate-binding protein
MNQLTRRQVLAGAAGAATLAVTGCGGGGGGEADKKLDANRAGAMDKFGVGDQFKATEPLTFSIMMLSNAAYPYKADWTMLTELTKRTNVKLDATVIPGSDYNQKRSVMISSGNAPMIIPKTYHPDEEAYIAGGAVLPVSDYVDLMPNFQDKVKKWKMEPDLDQNRQQDGKYYLLPGLHEQLWVDYSLAIRTDVLQQLNLTTPKSWDDLYNVLKAMKAAHPDVYPLSDRWSVPADPGANALFSVLGSTYGLYAGWSYQHTKWDSNAKKFVYTAATDQYKQMLTYLNKLVSEKLMDPESFTQTDDQARQKFASGRSFVISSNAQTLANQYRKDIAKIAGATVEKIPVPLGLTNGAILGSRLENGVMLSKKVRDSKNFVALMQFVDYLFYSDAGQLFAKWGIEGTTYTGSVEAGSFKLVPQVDWAGLNPGAPKNLQVDYGFSNGVFAYGGSTKLLNSQFPAEEKKFQEVMNGRPAIPLPPPRPLNADEREQVTLWESGLKDHVKQQSLKFALGQRPLTEFDAFVNELKGKNMTQYVDIVNKAADRYKKEHP